jgi:YesN/AraC family two-component response regulator
VRDDLTALGIDVASIGLGYVETNSDLSVEEVEKVRVQLESDGFELIDDKKQGILESVKTILIDEIHHLKASKSAAMNFSSFLEAKTGYDYSYLSHLFSEQMGTTIEQYIIALRIEKAKELLSYGEMTINEIAYLLDYSSTAHLSNQFKKVTGETPSQYRSSQKEHHRITLDKI